MLFESILSRFFAPRFIEEEVGFIDKNPHHILVNDKKSFKAMLSVLKQAASCVMDTEADSMHHYQEKLSLIQISVGKYHWLLDPLCGLNLKALWKCKALKNITFHACDYDLRLLYHFHGFCPQKIYDTSIAAKLLGEKQTGLAALVEKYFGIKLDKANQKSDWTRRPLSSEMCSYAVLDTVYLDAMKELQCKKLKSLGRMDWLKESCENILENSKKTRDDNPRDAWRLKGSNTFKPLELQLLRAAWNWRDKEARKKDVASYRILNPYLMMDIVRAAARAKGKISEQHFPRMQRNLKGALLQSFLRELNAAATAPANTFPQALPRKASPRTAINEDLREKLRELRNEYAAKLNIDSGILAKQNQLNILADDLLGNFKEKLEAANFMNWQREIWKELVSRAVLPKTLPELRAWAKERLAMMSEEEKAKESEELIFELLKHSALESGYVAAFYPAEFEPQIFPFLNKLATENRLLLPRVLDERNMDFVHIKNLEQDLQPGNFGIMEPKADLPAFEGSPAAFLVPGVVFGKDGNRIGHGKGYYDRFLASHKGIPKIGVAYKCQIRSTLPQNVTDVRMNEVVWIR